MAIVRLCIVSLLISASFMALHAKEAKHKRKRNKNEVVKKFAETGHRRAQGKRSHRDDCCAFDVIKHAFVKEKNWGRQKITGFETALENMRRTTFDSLNEYYKTFETAYGDLNSSTLNSMKEHSKEIETALEKMKSTSLNSLKEQSNRFETALKKMNSATLSSLNEYSKKIETLHEEVNVNTEILKAVLQAVDGNLLETFLCPSGWRYFGHSCYLIVGAKKTWFAAEQNCLSKGAHLVEINSWNENHFLKSLNYEGVAWLGASDIRNEGRWIWSASGRPLDPEVSFWADGEPNNANGMEDCLNHNIGKLYNLRWNDDSCFHKAASVCELDAFRYRFNKRKAN